MTSTPTSKCCQCPFSGSPLSHHGTPHFLPHHNLDYSDVIAPFLYKLGNFSSKSDFSSYAPLKFLTNWTSPITNASAQVEESSHQQAQQTLVPSVGCSQSDTLACSVPPPASEPNLTVWAAASDRNTQSAQAFVRGLQRSGSRNVSVQIIQENEDEGADTLTPHESCPV